MTRVALQLPDVTLCCVDTREPALALEALQRCRQGVHFGRTMLFTDLSRVVAPVPDGIELLPVSINSVAEYSAFMMRGLAAHVRTSHLLVVQWDGFVLHPQAWDPAFLHYDYLGAPWHDIPGDAGVGNGGFSLRSVRLLHALQDPALPAAHPEDLAICRDHRAALERRHGIRFPPRALAERFAFERTAPTGPTFGFHGLFHFDRVLPPTELHALLARLPDGMLGGLDAHDLARQLIRAGRLDTAGLIIDARRRLGLGDRRSWRLRALMACARWRAR
jgi:hypothetical protein